MPHEEGVLVKKPGCSAWFVNNFDTVEQVNDRRAERAKFPVNFGGGQKRNPISPPTKWPDPTFKHTGVFIDTKGRLNSEIKIDFEWRQFWGHPYGALFELEDQSLALVLHRGRKL